MLTRNNYIFSKLIVSLLGLFNGLFGLVFIHDPIKSLLHVFYVFLSKYQSNSVFLRLKLGRSSFRLVRTKLCVSDLLHGFKQSLFAIINAELQLVLLHVLPNLLLLLNDLLLVSLKLVNDQSHQFLLLCLQLELLQLVRLLPLLQLCPPLCLLARRGFFHFPLERKLFFLLYFQLPVKAVSLVRKVEVLLRLLLAGALESLFKDCLPLLRVEDIEHDPVHEDT